MTVFDALNMSMHIVEAQNWPWAKHVRQIIIHS